MDHFQAFRALHQPDPSFSEIFHLHLQQTMPQAGRHTIARPDHLALLAYKSGNHVSQRLSKEQIL